MKYFTELNSRMEGTIEECENPKGFEKVITYHKLSSGLAELLTYAFFATYKGSKILKSRPLCVKC